MLKFQETEECSYILSCNVFDFMDKLRLDFTSSCKKCKILKENLKIGHYEIDFDRCQNEMFLLQIFCIILLEKLFVFNLALENTFRMMFFLKVVIGGRNKYLINGSNANNTRVQDLFRSVQLNVNNPHFLIMQGRITKVLNMKPPEVFQKVFVSFT